MDHTYTHRHAHCKHPWIVVKTRFCCCCYYYFVIYLFSSICRAWVYHDLVDSYNKKKFFFFIKSSSSSLFYGWKIRKKNFWQPQQLHFAFYLVKLNFYFANTIIPSSFTFNSLISTCFTSRFLMCSSMRNKGWWWWWNFKFFFTVVRFQFKS